MDAVEQHRLQVFSCRRAARGSSDFGHCSFRRAVLIIVTHENWYDWKVVLAVKAIDDRC
jgi:hypothetical protein